MAPIVPIESGRLDGFYVRHGKRWLGLCLLVTALPLVCALAFPIALVNAVLFRDPRRVLFTQVRVGRDGRPFRIWKFRTMREEPPGAHFESWSGGADGRRVTRFGRLLRNTHLDELPQALNVLRGDMDLVGPRPEMAEIHAWACEEVEGFALRNVVRPGVTGLAQVTQGYAGRDAEAYRAKLAADREYVRTISLRTDLGLLLRTLGWMLAGRGWRSEQPVRTARHVADGPIGTMAPCPRPVSSSTPTASATTRARRIPSARAD
jgi:lipopolysaccharide/colanic/teichoic acid biosynthesis glycosyltransferase